VVQIWVDRQDAVQRRDRLERIRLSALQKLGRHDEAAASARKALEGKEDDVLAWLDHAVMLTNAKRHQEAIEAYTRAIALLERGVLIIGDITAMWFNRACERAFTGDLEGGLSDLAEAVRRSSRARGAGGRASRAPGPAVRGRHCS
jgi:tetratricopeptide (TPR) repeat protein